ncbi:uncharacterized protein LOC116205364 [Punica granatum]|uniref:Uncharacterized protein LOC116205364 n=1 Tax=Punica granatum TaxID=22663 RepID=A0A6P8DK84_PUNGR|nr:uncharacterized protein LOC116205364 [Punica granatum]
MSLESEDRYMSDRPNESTYEIERKSKISYSREFLLSMSGLDICKKLPSGFDQSILSEFEDASQEKHRIPGSLSSHGFRRNEYGSSPPTRGDLSNYNKGVHGRWDSRSSGRSDKDTDSQSGDSDSGKRYMNPSRRGWQAPEHDGLLGSGSFPRPSGYAPGASAPKFRPNDNYQLNKTTEPYQPPRPYKAVPHPRRETNDSYNDETFGSSECTSEDKAEEERKRRASFELMRKEQQKAFQERQKVNPERRRDIFDITTLLEDSGHEKRTFHKNDEVDEHTEPQEFSSDPAKSSLSSQAPAPRPLVPPGFAGAMQERKSNMVEVKMVSEVTISCASDKTTSNGPSDDQEVKQVCDKMGLTMKQHGSIDIQKTLSSESDRNVSSVLDISIQSLNEKDLFGNNHLSDAVEPLSTKETIEVDSEKAAGNKIMVQSSDSSTVLEKLFGSALALDVSGSSSILKQQHGQGEDSWSPRTVQSSKFARWFLEEDKKPSVHPGSGQPNELLSLIVGGEKGASSVPDAQAPEQLWPNSLFQGSQPTEGHITSNATTATTNKSDELFIEGQLEAAPVLTCEDLENSILSEISESGTKQQEPLPRWGMSDAEVNEPIGGVDNRASLHLLSLLQKGTDHGDTLSIPNVNAKFSDCLGSVESETVGNEPDNPMDPTNGTLPNLGKTLTLETLFGTAFMKELQSVGAPVSAQRGSGSAGSAKAEAVEPQAFPFTQMEADVFSSRNGSETGALTLNHRQPSNLEKLDKQFVVLDDLQTNVEIPQLQNEVRLPEEDSLIAVNDPLNLRGFMPGSGPPTKTEVLSSQTTPAHIAEKLATLNGNLKEKFVGGQGSLPFHVPLNKMEPDPFQSLHLQQSSPQLRPQQFNPMGSNFNLLDSYPGHSDSQMKLMAQDFPGSMMRPPIQHPGTGFTGFDNPPGHHHSLLQQMHMSGGLPPAHQFQGYLRAPQGQHPHPNHQMPAFNHEMNPMQGLAFGAHRQPSFGGLDMAHPAPDIRGGNGHPETLQRLIEMELRNANAKQVHPVAAAGAGGHISQGIYGPELDMGFRYR